MADNIKAFNNIKIVGVGGGGNNTIDVIKSSKYGDKINTFALNTDEQALQKSKADKTLAIGKHLTKGLGAGSKPEVGQEAATESINEIKEILKDTDLLFLTAGMGGGTGTGAAPEVAKIAHEMGILTIAIITLPFNFEGYMRLTYAVEGAKKIQKYADVTLVISNQVLVSEFPDVFVEDAFQLPDKAIESAIIVLLDLLNHNGGNFGKGITINDLPSFFENAGIALTAIGRCDDPNQDFVRSLATALNQTINDNILQMSMRGATKFVIKIDVAQDLEPQMQQLLTLPKEILTKFLTYDDEMIRKTTFEISPDIRNDDFKGVEVKIIATGFENSDEVFEKMINRAKEDMHSSMLFD